VQARVSEVRRGVVFAPFHYGAWDVDVLDPGRQRRQANELTDTAWDPISKQPLFKTAACKVTRIRAGDGPAPAPTTAASAPVGTDVPATTGAPGSDAFEDVLERTPAYPQDPALGTAVPGTHSTLIGGGA
jgi:hypothetical protein